MARLLKRRVALAVATVALLIGGAAVALGASSGAGASSSHRGTHVRHARGRHHDSLIAAAASYLGIDTKQLRQELRSGKTLAQIAAATSGHSEAGMIAALVKAREARLDQRITSFVNRAHSARAATAAMHRSRGLGRGRPGSVRAAALSYLGIARQQLVRELRSGKTLAQIAESTPGKSVAGLDSAILTAASRELASVVAHERAR
jgi:hypothetical protein